jgi:hypothetical protein
MAKKQPTEPTKPEPTKPEPVTTAPVLTPDLIAKLRSAGSIEAGVNILAPHTAPRPKLDATYELNPGCKEPLPQRRGACIKVITAAVQLNRPFKVADVTTALPDVKSAAYWTRKLAKTGHLTEAQ